MKHTLIQLPLPYVNKKATVRQPFVNTDIYDAMGIKEPKTQEAHYIYCMSKNNLKEAMLL